MQDSSNFKMFRIVLICLLASTLAGCHATVTKPDLSSFLNGHKAVVFVFLAPDCPLSQNYTLTLNELNSSFQAG